MFTPSQGLEPTISSTTPEVVGWYSPHSSAVLSLQPCRLWQDWFPVELSQSSQIQPLCSTVFNQPTLIIYTYVFLCQVIIFYTCAFLCHAIQKLISNDFEAFLETFLDWYPPKRLRDHWRAQVPNPALRWADWSLPRRHPWHWDDMVVGVAHGISRALPGPSLQFQPSKLFPSRSNNTQSSRKSPNFSPGFLQHPQGSRMTWMTWTNCDWFLAHTAHWNLWILPEIAIIEEILRPKSRCWVEEMSPLSLTFRQMSCPSLLQLVPDLSLAAKNNIQWMTAVVMRPTIPARPSLGHIALPRVLWP